MQFALFIIQADPDGWAGLSTDDRNRIHTECGAWHEKLVEGGHAVFASAFEPPSATVTVTECDGKGVVAQGPFASDQPAIGGFEMIECDSIDQAIALAEQFPALRAGMAVEVRPVVTGPCVD